MSKYRMLEAARNMRFRVQTADNETYVAVMDTGKPDYDNVGAVYYVVVVVLIYGLSIVMMIASHIRRNKQDGQLRSYLKEMAVLRKKNRREKLLQKMADLAFKSKSVESQKSEEAARQENKEDHVALYSRLPTETDEPYDSVSCKTSTDDFEDSVFRTETPKRGSRHTSKGQPSKNLSQKYARVNKSDTQIEVINENTVF